MSSLKEQNKLLSQAKAELEANIDALSSEVDQANVHQLSLTRDFESSNSQVRNLHILSCNMCSCGYYWRCSLLLQRSQLEQDIKEKAEEIKVLKERYDLLDKKHVDTREELILSKDHCNTLQKEVSI